MRARVREVHKEGKGKLFFLVSRGGTGIFAFGVVVVVAGRVAFPEKRYENVAVLEQYVASNSGRVNVVTFLVTVKGGGLLIFFVVIRGGKHLPMCGVDHVGRKKQLTFY